MSGRSAMQWSILSARASDQGLAMGCLREMEDVAAEALDACILSPQTISDPAANGLVSRAVRKFRGPVTRRYAPIMHEDFVRTGSSRGSRGLFVVAMNPSRLDMLDALPSDWRSRFDVVVGYVFDAFEQGWEAHADRFDHLFVPIRRSAKLLGESIAAQVHELAMAADVVHYGSARRSADRMISVNGYGRQHREHLEAFADLWNRPDSDRVVFHEGLMVRDVMRQRAVFWQLLTRSRIAMAYDVRSTQGAGRFPYSLLSQRWFESLAAGCAVVGRRARCPEAEELLDWDDATIELPEDTNEAIELVDQLLRDSDRLDAIHQRNYNEMLARHDWRHRLATMHQKIELDLPPSLEPYRIEQCKGASV